MIERNEEPVVSRERGGKDKEKEKEVHSSQKQSHNQK